MSREYPDERYHKKTYGEQVKHRLKKLKKRQEELAAACGKNKQTINRICTGKIKNPACKPQIEDILKQWEAIAKAKSKRQTRLK